MDTMKKKCFVACLVGMSLLTTTLYGVGVKGPVKDKAPKPVGEKYSTQQAMSDKAQLSTIAFSGLAFITGSSGADTFMPPGKVADFFGFQYMRDVDQAGYGHNTTFLTKAANNVLYILDDEQKQKLVQLAQTQAPLYKDFAYNRLPLMKAFRDDLEGNYPAGATGLDQEVVKKYTANMYEIDAQLTYERALLYGELKQSLTEEQKNYLAKMAFDNSATWPEVAGDEGLKKTMSHTEFVAVMTYASEFFSWYKGDVASDTYFCPERHGTYFGGFFMKDYPAMNNPDYFISTAVTGDKGQMFLDILTQEQKALMTRIIDEQRGAIEEIAVIRKEVSEAIRKGADGETIDEEKMYSLIRRYGELDGQVSALYATTFSQINRTLTDEQREQLVELRDLDVVPEDIYMFSTPTKMPEIPSTDFFFGIEPMPEDAGVWKAPENFGVSKEQSPTKPPKVQVQRQVVD